MNGSTSTQNTFLPNGSKIPIQAICHPTAPSPTFPVEYGDIPNKTKLAITARTYNYLIRYAKSLTQEISGQKALIYLDEYNIEKYLQAANQMQKRYGSNKIDNLAVTGDEYKQIIQRLADTAYDIIEGKLIPDIFDRLPMKKDRTFKSGQSTPILDGKLFTAYAQESYITGTRIMLTVTTTVYDKAGTRDEAPKGAALAIVDKQSISKIYPLLNDALEVQDIKTPTQYIP